MSDGKEKKNFVFRAMEIFGEVFALNVLFVVGSLPIFTIGASLCAMYSLALKLAHKEDLVTVRGFIKEYKANFKQGTLAWLIVVAAAATIWAGLYYVFNFDDILSKIYVVIVVIEILIFALTVPFLFPLIARYENSLLNTIKNSFLLSISNLGSCIKVILAWFMPVFISLVEPLVFLNTWYLWLLLIFGFIAYGSSFTMKKVFSRVGEVKEQKVQQAEAEKKAEKEKYNMNGTIIKRAMMQTGEEDTDASEESEE